MKKFLTFLAFIICIRGDAQVATLVGVVRQEPMFYRSYWPRIPNMYGVVVGFGLGGNSRFQFFGVTARFLPTVEDTFTVQGRTPNDPRALCLATRRTTCFGMHIPVNVNVFRTEFVGLYIGMDLGIMWGRSKFDYDSGNEEFDPDGPFPDEADKVKIRAAPGGLHLGVLYEFERWSPYAEIGFFYSGLQEIPGVDEAWLTFQVGVLLTDSDEFRIE